MTISVCVVAYNEENALPGILENIRQQDYPHKNMEIILVDSMSIDNTRKIMVEFQKKEKSFWGIQVLDNPGKRLAPGWNVAIKNYKLDVILRVDAHAEIPKDFVRKNIELLQSGEMVCGGRRPNIIDAATPWKETLLLAEQSMFGSSMAFYRRGQKKMYVKSVFHGAYRREVFDTVGEFNEKLGRTEDNEMNYRIRLAGYRICYDPEIISYQHTRSSLKGMLKQKFGNGYWVALTMKVCPQCFSYYHFVPFLFVIGILFTSLLMLMGYPELGIIMWVLYWILALSMSFLSVIHERRNKYHILLPVLFFLLHVSYGIGSLFGFLKLPFWKYEE